MNRFLTLTILSLALSSFAGTQQRVIPQTSEFWRETLTNETLIQAQQRLGIISNGVVVIGEGGGPIGVLDNTNLPNSVVLKSLQSWQQLTNGLGLTNVAFAIAESYANKVGATRLTSRQNLHTFLNGLASMNLASNLADFAFFNAGMNIPRAPVSWKGTAVINGAPPNQLKGGIEFNNLQGGTNSIYWTNMPPTPNGRTIIIWASQNFNQAAANNVNAAIVELNGTGASPNIQGAILFPDSGGALPYWYNGSQDIFGPRIQANNSANAFFCAALGSDSTGGFLLFQRDDVRSFTGYHTANTHPESPVVLQLAGRTPNFGAGWSGLVRGFAYFNTVLTTNQILAINALVPRVGVIIEGDSKSTPDKWQPWWVQTENTWGLLSVRTNSAVSGSSVSHLDQPGASMEDRFPGDSLFTNTTQFPINVYALRGAQNDEASDPTGGINAWNGLTNLWAQAHASGDRVLAFTLDRCSSLTTVSFSNTWAYINYQIRANPQLYDYLVDADQFYQTALASYQPWTNTAYYSDGIHETLAGAKLFGSNAVSAACSPGFDFEDARWVGRNADTAATAQNALYAQGGMGALSVTAFGAVGNLVVDDTAAIQACLDACAKSNYSCIFPSGVAGYRITSPLFINGTNGFNVRGGFYSTAVNNPCRIVQTTANTSCFVVTNLTANQGLEFSISDMSLLGAGTNAGYGITVSNLFEALQTQTRISRVTVQGFSTGILLTNAGTVDLNDSWIIANFDGVNIGGLASVVRSDGNRFHVNYRYQLILPYVVNFVDTSSTVIVGAGQYGVSASGLQVNFQGTQIGSGSIHPPLGATNCDMTVMGCTFQAFGGATPFSIEATNVNLTLIQSLLLCDTNGLQLFEINPRQVARNFGTRSIQELLSVSGVLSTNRLSSDFVSATNVLAQGTITPAALGTGPRPGTNFLRDDGVWVPVGSGGGGGISTFDALGSGFNAASTFLVGGILAPTNGGSIISTSSYQATNVPSGGKIGNSTITTNTTQTQIAGPSNKPIVVLDSSRGVSGTWEFFGDFSLTGFHTNLSEGDGVLQSDGGWWHPKPFLDPTLMGSNLVLAAGANITFGNAFSAGVRTVTINSSGGGGSSGFDAITTGVNTTGHLTVGTGGILDTSGSGSIKAKESLQATNLVSGGSIGNLPVSTNTTSGTISGPGNVPSLTLDASLGAGGTAKVVGDLSLNGHMTNSADGNGVLVSSAGWWHPTSFLDPTLMGTNVNVEADPTQGIIIATNVSGGKTKYTFSSALLSTGDAAFVDAFGTRMEWGTNYFSHSMTNGTFISITNDTVYVGSNLVVYGTINLANLNIANLTASNSTFNNLTVATNFVQSDTTGGATFNGGLTNTTLLNNRFVATDANERLVSWQTGNGITVDIAAATIYGSTNFGLAGASIIGVDDNGAYTKYTLGPGLAITANPYVLSITGAADGSGFTNLTYQLRTNSVNTGVFPLGQTVISNLTGNITVAGFSGVDMTRWREGLAIMTNSTATDWGVTFGSGIKVHTNGATGMVIGQTVWCTNKQVTLIPYGIGYGMTNVAAIGP